MKCQRREDGSVNYFAVMVEEVNGADRFAAGEPAAAGKSRPDLGGDDRLPDYKALSGREREVAGLIGMGRTVKEIAGGLALSEKTVSTYRTRILTKLKLKSTAELIRYAIKNGLAV